MTTKTRNRTNRNKSYSNVPLFFADAPYGRAPADCDEMMWIKHHRMLVDKAPALIDVIQQVLRKAAKKQFPGYDPAQYQANVERIIAKRENEPKGNDGMNADASKAVSAASPDEITAATEVAESAEFLEAQAQAIDCFLLTVESARRMERAAAIRGEFNRQVLEEDDFCNSATKMLELAEELQSDAALAEHLRHDFLAADLETHLLDAFSGLAKVEDYLPDDVVFKLNLLEGCRRSGDGTSSFFSSARNIRRAEFFELIPQG